MTVYRYPAATIQELRDRPKPPNNTLVEHFATVIGSGSQADGLRSKFIWNPASSNADDNYLTVAPTAGGVGRWEWYSFGAYYLNADFAGDLKAALESGVDHLVFDADVTYNPVTLINVTGAIEVDGQGHTILFTGNAPGPAVTFEGPTVISNLIFDGGLNAFLDGFNETGMIRYDDTVHETHVTYRNIRGGDDERPYGSRYFFGADTYHEFCRWENISGRSNTAVDASPDPVLQPNGTGTGGFCGGALIMNDNAAARPLVPSVHTFESIHMEDIWTRRNTLGDLFVDSDGVRQFIYDIGLDADGLAAVEDTVTTISNSVFRNVNKSAWKIQQSICHTENNTVVVDDMKGEGQTSVDFGGRCQRGPRYTSVNDTVRGPIKLGLSVQGDEADVLGFTADLTHVNNGTTSYGVNCGPATEADRRYTIKDLHMINGDVAVALNQGRVAIDGVLIGPGFGADVGLGQVVQYQRGESINLNGVEARDATAPIVLLRGRNSTSFLAGDATITNSNGASPIPAEGLIASNALTGSVNGILRVDRLVWEGELSGPFIDVRDGVGAGGGLAGLYTSNMHLTDTGTVAAVQFMLRIDGGSLEEWNSRNDVLVTGNDYSQQAVHAFHDGIADIQGMHLKATITTNQVLLRTSTPSKVYVRDCRFTDQVTTGVNNLVALLGTAAGGELIVQNSIFDCHEAELEIPAGATFARVDNCSFRSSSATPVDDNTTGSIVSETGTLTYN